MSIFATLLCVAGITHGHSSQLTGNRLASAAYIYGYAGQLQTVSYFADDSEPAPVAYTKKPPTVEAVEDSKMAPAVGFEPTT